ncbi:MAG: STAS domain-containing protein [Clostridiales bacterium]|nr:STAS domain-containing protein [Clostridiales bacterium]
MALIINTTNNTETRIWEFTVAGEIDISNAKDLKAKLEDSLAETSQSITIDLSELRYIDSTGLGVIIGVYSTIKKEGLSVKVINPRDNVKKLLNISGLDSVLC